ncbi:hypothetical protein [Calidifontibacter indicus]|uniref:hypothetical protein n=1 Tax=Calidifontibacter indicus TaxID=419650 RepID=UPI000E253876|nr:hypothetical protein [Calidifontibacter indicus]
MEGLAINTITVPEVGQHRFEADPFNTGLVGEWSLPALGFTSILTSLVEPEQPEVDWDDVRIEQCRVRLHEIRASVVDA